MSLVFHDSDSITLKSYKVKAQNYSGGLFVPNQDDDIVTHHVLGEFQKKGDVVKDDVPVDPKDGDLYYDQIKRGLDIYFDSEWHTSVDVLRQIVDAPDFVWNVAYEAGDFVKNEGVLYMAKVDIANAWSAYVPGIGAYTEWAWEPVIGLPPYHNVARYNFSRYATYRYGDVVEISFGEGNPSNGTWVCMTSEVNQTSLFGNGNNTEKYGPVKSNPDSYIHNGVVLWAHVGDHTASSKGYLQAELDDLKAKINALTATLEQYIDGWIQINNVPTEVAGETETVRIVRSVTKFSWDNVNNIIRFSSGGVDYTVGIDDGEWKYKRSNNVIPDAWIGIGGDVDTAQEVLNHIGFAWNG